MWSINFGPGEHNINNSKHTFAMVFNRIELSKWNAIQMSYLEMEEQEARARASALPNSIHI